MIYQATVNKKGQIVIPVEIRRVLNLQANQLVTLTLTKDKAKAVIKPEEDFVDLIGTFKPKKKVVSALKLREEFEKNYERA